MGMFNKKNKKIQEVDLGLVVATKEGAVWEETAQACRLAISKLEETQKQVEKELLVQREILKFVESKSDAIKV